MGIDGALRDEAQRCLEQGRNDRFRDELLGRGSRLGLVIGVRVTICSLRVNTPGGFGAHPDHDAHLLSTLSAIQILTIQDALDRLDVPRVVKCACLRVLSGY